VGYSTENGPDKRLGDRLTRPPGGPYNLVVFIDVCFENNPASQPIWPFLRPPVVRPRFISCASVNKAEAPPIGANLSFSHSLQKDYQYHDVSRTLGKPRKK
jgi:hypothetical protein